MMQPLGVILAGGRSRRMGGRSKAGLMLGDVSLLTRATARLAPQVAALAVSANEGLDTDLPVLRDPVGNRPGPLAGILAAMDWASDMGGRCVVTVPVDTPFFPCDLVPRLLLAAEAHPEGLAIAATADGRQPAFGLWPIALRDDLAKALSDGVRKVTDWTDGHGAIEALFEQSDPPAFFNINTPEDHTRAAHMLGTAG